MTDARTAPEQNRLITGDELACMPDRGPCELVDGRIVPMSPTSPQHGRIELNIAFALREFVRSQNLGTVMTGEVGIFTKHNPDRVRGADVLFMSHGQYARRTAGRAFLDIAPELVVEILSAENAHVDMGQKVREYLSIGVRLVLIVDPDTRTITAHHPSGPVQRFREPELVPCDEAL
ncbi:MAG: Uma2 family endonuclease, partial [Acidimicrobiia bacterium]